jgi:hypothetical protein
MKTGRKRKASPIKIERDVTNSGLTKGCKPRSNIAAINPDASSDRITMPKAVPTLICGFKVFLLLYHLMLFQNKLKITVYSVENQTGSFMGNQAK